MESKLNCIFLDMDGVLVNWHAGVEKVLGIKFTDEQLKERQIENTLDLGLIAFWKAIDDSDRFWEDLEPYPWWSELWEKCSSHCPTYILSKPHYLSPSSSSGKARWLKRMLGPEFEDFIFTKHKHLCANPNALLIDDHQKMVDNFIKHGGNALLFPQPWNSASESIEDFLTKLSERLDSHSN